MFIIEEINHADISDTYFDAFLGDCAYNLAVFKVKNEWLLWLGF